MPHSTHKRKRSAQRADRARAVPGGSGRCITTVYAQEGEEKRSEAIESHPFNHQVGTSPETHTSSIFSSPRARRWPHPLAMSSVKRSPSSQAKHILT